MLRRVWSKSDSPSFFVKGEKMRLELYTIDQNYIAYLEKIDKNVSHSTKQKEKRPSDWKRFVIPDVCPVCGAKTEREKDTADIKCTSPNCPAQLERHIINFVGRDAMDIKGFGTVYIEELVRLGYINNVADTKIVFNNSLVSKKAGECMDNLQVGKSKINENGCTDLAAVFRKTPDIILRKR